MLSDRQKKSVVVTVLLMAAILGVPLLSYGISLHTTHTFFQMVQVFSAGGSIGLSAILAYLYLRMNSTQEERTGIHEDQTDILQNQEKYSRMEKEVLLDFEGVLAKDNEMKVSISNYGGGTLVGLNVKTSVAQEDGVHVSGGCATELTQDYSEGIRNDAKMLGPRKEGTIWLATPEFEYQFGDVEIQDKDFSELSRRLSTEDITEVKLKIGIEGVNRFGDQVEEILINDSIAIYSNMDLSEAISRLK
jgi:hypothetical protein